MESCARHISLFRAAYFSEATPLKEAGRPVGVVGGVPILYASTCGGGDLFLVETLRLEVPAGRKGKAPEQFPPVRGLSICASTHTRIVSTRLDSHYVQKKESRYKPLAAIASMVRMPIVMCVNQKPVDGSADQAQEQQQTCHGPSYRPRSLSRIERPRFQPVVRGKAVSLVRLGPVQVAMLGRLLFSRLSSALGHLVKMTADLLFGAA